MKILGFEFNIRRAKADSRLRGHTGDRRRYSGVRYGDGSQTPEGLPGSGDVVNLDHTILRKNARNQEYSVPQVRSIIDRFADSVADVGVIPKADLNYKALGISETQAMEISEYLDKGFDRWASSKKSDLRGRNNFYQNQRLYARWQQRDNDQFTRLHYGATPGLINPLQISFTDPDQILGDAYTTTYGDLGWIQDGIVRDLNGVEIGYNVRTLNPATRLYKDSYIPAKTSDGKRILMLHGYCPEYANQGRGYTRFAHSMHKFSQITSFDISHIEKAIGQASILGYVKPSKNAPASDPFEHLKRGRGIQPLNATFGADPKPDPDVTGTDSAEFYEIPEAATNRGVPLFITDLNSGEDLGQFDMNTPVTGYDTFMDTFLSYLTSSFGQPLSINRMKFLQNYSASSAEIQLWYRVTQIWLNEMVSDFCDPVREMWIAEEVASGRIVLPGFSDPYLRDLWLACSWHGAPMIHTDPVKTAQANYMNAVMGAHTFDDVALNHNGSSGRANRAQLKRETEEFDTSPYEVFTKKAAT